MIDINTILDSKIRYINDVPVLTRNQIETTAEQILAHYMPEALVSQTPTNIEGLMENCFDLHLDFQTIQPDGAILGETIFSDGYRQIFDDTSLTPQIIEVKKGTIILDSFMSEKMETRTLFTEGHEFGHWCLHGPFYSATDNRACRSHRYQRMYFPHYQAKTPIEWTEWQANTFAAAILLPRSALRITLREFLEENKLTWQKLIDFTEYSNRLKYIELLNRIAKSFCVSNETARIRMNKLCNLTFPN